jgi:MoaA/NifB/PqqE/SkfB family radical SAM enzyme
MKEFYPWSIDINNSTIRKYMTGRFSVLDVQVSGKCNYGCIYCDSPDRSETSNINFDHLENLIRQEHDKYEWMFICGLGEPLCEDNRITFLRLLELCKETGIKCSSFTNGSKIDENVLAFIREKILYPIIKVDTFSLEFAEELYGTSQVQKTLNNVELLFKIAHDNVDMPYCQIAASIVPTLKNLNEIPAIVKRCVENNVFPLIGQLEYAGKAIVKYHDLCLTREQLLKLKNDISASIGMEYRTPVCPSVISGIHICNDGYISVDKYSGLSCSWFWLKTPQKMKLCKVNDISSFSEAEEKILEYRKTTINNMASLCVQIEEHPFGGCGGNIKDLANEYVKIHEAIK